MSALAESIGVHLSLGWTLPNRRAGSHRIAAPELHVWDYIVRDSTSVGDSEMKRPQKLQDRDFHIPRLAVPKTCFQTQVAAVRILEVSVPLCRHHVKYLSAEAGGRECIAQASVRGTEGLRWCSRRAGREKASGKKQHRAWQLGNGQMFSSLWKKSAGASLPRETLEEEISSWALIKPAY